MYRILALLDLSGITSDVLEVARNLAQSMGGHLYLINVATPEADFEGEHLREDTSRPGVARELHRKHRTLEILEMELRKQGIEATALLVRGTSARSDPVPKILEEVERLRPDLIVMGSRGHGPLYKLLMGSVSEAVIRHAGRPVVLVCPPRRGDQEEAGAAPQTT